MARRLIFLHLHMNKSDGCVSIVGADGIARRAYTTVEANDMKCPEKSDIWSPYRKPTQVVGLSILDRKSVV